MRKKSHSHSNSPAPTLSTDNHAGSSLFIAHISRKQGIWCGNLSELSAALRSGELLPTDVPLLRLTREVLALTEGIQTPPELLPPLGSVIALKARLLLPIPTPDSAVDTDWEEYLEEIESGIEALAELDTWVAFLNGRREARAQVLPAPAYPVQLPRRERKSKPQRSLEKLLKAAEVVRTVSVPLLARDRLTLGDAWQKLREAGKRLGSLLLGNLGNDWSEKTTYFAALLEGIKEGQCHATQTAPFAEIEIHFDKHTTPDSEEDG